MTGRKAAQPEAGRVLTMVASAAGCIPTAVANEDTILFVWRKMNAVKWLFASRLVRPTRLRFGALVILLIASNAYGQICNIRSFLEQCPTTDPAYDQIRRDVVLRRDGVVISYVSCEGAIPLIATANYTDEVIVLQALRTIYYLKGKPLPWSTDTLYGWLTSEIGGINISATGPDEFIGNAFGDGKKYMSIRAKDAAHRDALRGWIGISEMVELIMHERRHADPGFEGHVSCCSVGQNGCDQKYDEANLSPYGIQWWLRRQFIEGGFYTGYSCYSDMETNSIVSFMRTLDNNEGNRYCQSPPVFLTDANDPAASCRKWACLIRAHIPILMWRWLPIWVPIIIALLGVVVLTAIRRTQTRRL